MIQLTASLVTLFSVLSRYNILTQVKDAVTETLSEWNIDSTKVLMLVTDNGTSVVKAMRLVSEEATAPLCWQ